VCHAPANALVRSGKLEVVLITGFPTGVLACNCYVVARDRGGEAFIVDPGQGAMPRLRRLLNEHGLAAKAVLLTHGHIDHIWSARQVSDGFGIPALIHPEDRSMLTDPIKGFGPRLGQLLVGALFREPKRLAELADGDKLDIGGITVTVDHTPGHTRGSVTFRITAETGFGDRTGPVDVVFSGDTLFCGSVGRSDLPGGSGRDLLGSIVTRLLVLDDDTVVLPGHGDATTIGTERRTNPFLEGLSS
jgi:glyoxylase-like metal-dependent hydrolase (beta-lactamase superfamily II)